MTVDESINVLYAGIRLLKQNLTFMTIRYVHDVTTKESQ
jgi:hypothetical protein